MAGAKGLRKKIRSIANTKKITRTMEMVSTAKSKRAQDRIKASTPYSTKLSEILASLAASGTVEHPFFAVPAELKKTLALVVTANRGLCGGYNANVLRLAEVFLKGEREAGREVEVQVAGKKGIARFRFLKAAVAKSFTHIDDKVSFRDAEAFAGEMMQRFRAGEIQRVVIFATKYFSSASQKPVEHQVLPIQPPKAAEKKGAAGKAPHGTEKKGMAAPQEFIFEPSREAILESLVPLSVKNAVYRILVEATASEQIARRLAMKQATDNAEEMIRHYTRMYNRQRQAGITQQLTEIVAGADALD